MCEFHTLTVMTTDPQLRKTLRGEITASTINSSTTRTRDPTYAREHFNNFARMPYILRTSNTLAAPTAAKRILRGVSRPTESSNNNKQPHHDSYDQTMRKHKGCRTNTAPSGKPDQRETHETRETRDAAPQKNRSPAIDDSTTSNRPAARFSRSHHASRQRAHQQAEQASDVESDDAITGGENQDVPEVRKVRKVREARETNETRETQDEAPPRSLKYIKSIRSKVHERYR